MNQQTVDTSKSFEDRIAFLRICNDLYETDGTSPISDAEYDKEYYALQEINPDHPFFNEVGGRGEEHIYGTSVKHAVIMGSLNKSPNMDEFAKWLIATYGTKEVLTVIVEHKVDGSSLGCLYENGKLKQVLTRGDGITGIDVTKNAKYVDGIPETIDCKEEVEVRGECYKNRFDFYARWAGEYANPRNFTAGSLNQKDAKVTKDRGLSFLAYEVVRKEFKSEADKVRFVVDNKFANFHSVVPKSILKVTGTASHIIKAVKKYMEAVDRTKLPYEVDGIVVKLDDIKRAKSMGTTNEGRRPKANRAVKFPCEQKATKLIDIEWNVGRTGALAPVGLLEPVQLAGTVVKRVSLHNPKFIEEMKLNLGCSVLLQKSGDIIPYVVRKIKDGKSPIKIPENCPCCGSELEWDKTRTNKVCSNDTCVSQLNANLEHWFKKIGVKGIGSGIIEKLTSLKVDKKGEQKPLVESLVDMYRLKEYTVLLQGEFGARAFEKIQESINSVRKMSLAKFIEALGIGKIGTMSKEITAVASTVEDVDNLTVEELVKIPGFAETKAKAFLSGWKAMRKSIGILLKEYIELEADKLASNKLQGKSFCFTGSFSNPTRKEMEQMVVDNGGKLSSVSKNLTALVWDGEMTGSKYDKAQKNKIPIIDQKSFLNFLV